MSDRLIIAQSRRSTLDLLLPMANRHGLIAGATGTGKTVTLQVLAEQFSRVGIPVFMADIKGDLSGLSQPGGGNIKVEARAKELDLASIEYADNPVIYWDVFGQKGHPLRATISDVGPVLLARILNLNDTQTGVLTAVFKVADDQGWLLLDLKDLRAMLQYASQNAQKLAAQYGNISAASVGAIQRGLLQLEHEGGEHLFGEPMLNFADLLQTNADGRGVISILSAETLHNTPRLYATLLLWLLSELYENLPEVGDLDKPKLVFFFDEAHLLFNDAPRVLLNKIEQVVRLIRSKAVGIYFVSQNPLDIPDVILGQLGNRVQHALRAFTPKDQKAVKSAAQTFRPNPHIDVEAAITELAVGDALISFLDEKGRPQPVEIGKIFPPMSRLGPVTDLERQKIIRKSGIFGYYEEIIDRESAYEILKDQVEKKTGKEMQPEGDPGFDWRDILGKKEVSKRSGRQPQGIIESMARSAARTVGTEIGRQIMRGILGSILGKTRR
ncbi:helicase HerA-like domain-containing protein [Nitrosomonas communis]|uniref:Helicase HerA-like C-terminal domain-containing protein n=1 Tax=Nitrosomonas communis TaxID=44574 RepID=A0A1H2ULP6_9PROT|nr:helicase HerA-like domain-containing protein [Nitrosomonas communis]SDW56414.1 hypothetical protein SAMN05421882_101645 [Nitrosomonas communis]